MRVFPDGGDADERAGHGKRAAVSDSARGEECGGAFNGQGGLPDQCNGHQQGVDGEGCDSQGA